MSVLARRVRGGEVDASFFERLDTADFLEGFAEALESHARADELEAGPWDGLTAALMRASLHPDD